MTHSGIFYAISSGLLSYAEAFEESIRQSDGDTSKCIDPLLSYFKALKEIDNNNQFGSEESLKESLRYWSDGVTRLSAGSPSDALEAAVSALNYLIEHSASVACEAAILNTVCVNVNLYKRQLKK
jgi:hypothetical protein